MFQKIKKNLLNQNSRTLMSFRASRGTDAKGVVRSLLRDGRLEAAVNILVRIKAADSPTYAALLQACLNKEAAIPEAKLIHAHIIQTEFKLGMFLNTKFVTVYAMSGCLADARQMFDEMRDRDVVSWTSMIAAYLRHGDNEGALLLFYGMIQTGIHPDHFTFATILPACANMVDLELGRILHQRIVTGGFEQDVFIGSAVIDMYVKCGNMDDARHMFDKMSERDVVLWTAMIAGYSQNGYVGEALKLFQKMPERNVVSWNAMIVGYAQNGRVDEAVELFQQMPKQDVVSGNALIAGYAQNGQIDRALQLFQRMPERNVVSWNSLIRGYAQRGLFTGALKLFQQMKATGVKPNSVGFTSILPVCANLAALGHGKEVHEDIIRCGFQCDLFLENGLIDMYAKCGSIEDACKVFDTILIPDVVSYTSMIIGYAMHGFGREVLELFERMQHSGVKPNSVTFVGVLSACCHTGLVDDAWKYFDLMRNYHITPVMEHYCCMVDLLGRAGYLKEAHDFVDKMPMEPPPAIWGHLLAACRSHGNIELGEIISEKLFELDSKNAAHYVLLSNIYAAAGRWEGVQKVRKMMKDREIKKMPACSWIEVDNKVCAFLVGD